MNEIALSLLTNNRRRGRIEKGSNKGFKTLDEAKGSDDEIDQRMRSTTIDTVNDFETESSILFEPYRAIGYITSSTPFYIHKNEEDRLMTVSVDHAFHVYNLDKLRLVYISNSVKQKIMQLQTHKNTTYTLLSNDIIIKWDRMHVKESFGFFDTPVVQFLVIATYMIVLCEGGNLYVIDLETSQIKTKIELNFEAYYFMHPITYLNKIIIAGENDCIQLWNIEA